MDAFFALRVRGDSMVDAGIYDGDVVIVRPQSTAEKGNTVVALIYDEATVKKFPRKGNKIWLIPANLSM
jgi:repressor LexA